MKADNWAKAHELNNELNQYKELVVKEIHFTTPLPSPGKISKKLDSKGIPFHLIDCVNWKEFPYKPEVKFRIAYSGDELYIQFNVREKYILAECEHGDDSCWPSYDSCVEFFVSPGSDSSYYNFEFSCIGYCLIQSGKPGPGRTRLPLDITDRIRSESTLGSKSFGLKEGHFEWTLTAAIPFSIMHQSSPKGKTWRANFYKCGDNLPEKAYLSWNPVGTQRPDFHRPEFFGSIQFK